LSTYQGDFKDLTIHDRQAGDPDPCIYNMNCNVFYLLNKINFFAWDTRLSGIFFW
jgi:hypothetical protein